VGQDFGVSRRRERREYPRVDMNCDASEAGKGISSYGVSVNFCNAGRGVLSRANMSGEECIESSVMV